MAREKELRGPPAGLFGFPYAAAHSSPRGSITIFWPSQALQVVQQHTYRQNTHLKKKKDAVSWLWCLKSPSKLNLSSGPKAGSARQGWTKKVSSSNTYSLDLSAGFITRVCSSAISSLHVTIAFIFLLSWAFICVISKVSHCTFQDWVVHAQCRAWRLRGSSICGWRFGVSDAWCSSLLSACSNKHHDQKQLG